MQGFFFQISHLDVANLTTFTSQSGENNPSKSQSFFSFPKKLKKRKKVLPSCKNLPPKKKHC
jgi:hypothetical protein